MASLREVVIASVDVVDSVLGPLFAGFGLSLTAFLACSFFLCILPRLDAPWCVVDAVVGLYFFTQVFLNYIRCMRTNPGRLPPTHSESNPFPACSFCHASKPPRSHHCHSCGTCVLDMDHHCVWMNNCIGRFNYLFFWRFLFFAWIGCAFVASVAHAVTPPSPSTPDDSMIVTYFVVLPYVLSLCIGLAVLGFWLWHVYLLVSGQTSLDAILRYRMRLKAKPVTWSSMQDNISRVLGPSWSKTLFFPNAVVHREDVRPKGRMTIV
ncbi:unnamed protein product [Aphanomyces euteiches]|uniref:Palmitoyltransferase n=1 Tax=Aphanomyces euteiches TaxID=100861 RepID=A0A6G0WNC1_9STRA|nr:hypothetical protein Ae201684_013419 [Aphanomyces euteiches]KAH9062934.1 hypothetical protein Ae201684P_009200 [Aphanomyces euteiches]KAH9086384.1 hypothetical protein LEN26_020147 [Aphanomyces euteiches]KAH9128628.1 hypothetical protein AeMF1_001246 [Aphanomyces euteiches]KAH9143564.1 hypothetical protein AeRB84_012446 [Aphanomyces euteiches]